MSSISREYQISESSSESIPIKSDVSRSETATILFIISSSPYLSNNILNLED